MISTSMSNDDTKEIPMYNIPIEKGDDQSRSSKSKKWVILN